MDRNDPVLVIGAGVAGLMCARRLVRAGRTVVLLEQDDEVGGRVRTTIADGFRLDDGFQVFFTAYPTLRAELDLPALKLCPFRPAAHIAGTGVRHALIGDAIADASLFFPTVTASTLTLGDKLRMLRMRSFARGLTFDECFDRRFDQLTTREFLTDRGFTAAAMRTFFAPFYGGILLDRSLDTSASVLLYTFKMLAEGSTVVPSDGMSAIPAQLAATLPSGTLRTGQSVVRILRDEHAASGVVLQSGEQLRGSTVVLACEPPSIAALALTAGLRVPVPDTRLGCTTVYLRSAAPLLPGKALWLNAAHNAAVSHAITISNVAPSYAPPNASLTAATILGADADVPTSMLIPRVLNELTSMCFTAQPAGAELLAVCRVPYSQYAQPPGSVGRRLAAETGVSGLFLASEAGHTSSLEGAARGGVAAADAVIRDARSG
jgi:phytoene dehydrogenase-like protein